MVLSLEELLKAMEAFRESKKIVFTNGCFDILHAGHAYYLKKAKELGVINALVHGVMYGKNGGYLFKLWVIELFV